MSNLPKVSIIVLNWNGAGYIQECVDTLLQQTYENKEVIVVDNASTDNSVELMKNVYGDSIKLVISDKNLGYTGGNNFGLKFATGDFVFLINNDTKTDIHCIAEMVKVAQTDSSIGCLACKILFYSEPNRIDNVGLWLYRDGLNRVIGRNEIDEGQYDAIQEVVSPSGCAGLWRRDLVLKVGGFDDKFGFYGDDIELGLKVKLLGYKCMYVPTAKVYHRGSVSMGSYSKKKAFLVERNRIWVLLKLFPLRDILISPYYTAKRYFYNIYSILSGKGAAARFSDSENSFSLAKILFDVYVSAFSELPYILAERRKLQKMRKIRISEFRKWYTEKGIPLKDLVLVD